MIKKISLPITENTSVLYGNIFCQFIYKKKHFSYTTTLLTSMNIGLSPGEAGKNYKPKSQ